MKQPYQTPDATLCRVFLEKSVAAQVSLLISGADSVQQTNWDEVPDEPINTGTGRMSELLWTGY